MDQITIDIPEGIDPEHKKQIISRLDRMAKELADAPAEQLEWLSHLERLDRGYADAVAGQAKDSDRAFDDIRARAKEEMGL